MEKASHNLSLRELGFMEPGEVASLLDVKPVTLCNWRAAEKGPPFTKVHGNKIVYPVAGVQRWLAQQTITPEVPGTLARPRRGKRLRAVGE